MVNTCMDFFVNINTVYHIHIHTFTNTTGWGPPVMFVGLKTIITPINYSYIYHKATYKVT